MSIVFFNCYAVCHEWSSLRCIPCTGISLSLKNWTGKRKKLADSNTLAYSASMSVTKENVV